MWLLAALAMVFWGACWSTSVARGVTVSNARFGFTLEVPQEYRPLPSLLENDPSLIYAYYQGGETYETGQPLLLIERLNGVLARATPVMPDDVSGRMFKLPWRSVELHAAEVMEEVDGASFATYNVQVPLRKEAIQLTLVGPAERKDEFLTTLTTLLASLEGESDWIHSQFDAEPTDTNAADTNAADTNAADTDANAFVAADDSAAFRVLLALAAIVIVVAGLFGFWWLGTRAPKGTVLGFATVLLGASWLLEDIPVREVRLACGAMRLLGLVGIILGLIDVFRTRKPQESRSPVEPNG